jgi:hypothetical protein
MTDNKSSQSSIFALAGSILVAGLTASLSYWTSSSADREKALVEQRKEAYVGYISALDKDRVAHMDFKCDLEKDKLCQLRIDFELQAGASLRRIGLYGDPSVVHATAEYIRKVGRPGAGSCDPSTWKLDLGMYLEMRRSVLGRQDASELDLADLLLPCKIPSSSTPATK